MERRTPLRRTGRLKPVSDRRRAEGPARDAVRARTLSRAGWKCQAAEIVPEIECWGPLDTDERKSRGVNPGGHLDDSNTQALCRAHHTWRTDEPEEAWKRGLRVKAWEGDEPLVGDVVCRGTLGRVCGQVEYKGRDFGSLEQLLPVLHDEGLDVPIESIEEALADTINGGQFDLNTCFCCVDPDPVLKSVGLRWADDPTSGNWIVLAGMRP